jgi:hypothetical protein
MVMAMIGPIPDLTQALIIGAVAKRYVRLVLDCIALPGQAASFATCYDSEFVSRDLDLWADANNVTLDFLAARQANRQRVYGSLQQQAASGMLERSLAPNACGCPGKVGELVQRLQ